MKDDDIVKLVDDALRKLYKFPTKPVGLLQAA